MSKHRNKSRGNQNMNNSNPFGLNQQMLDMLGMGDINVDQLSNMFSSMGTEGFDMNVLSSLLGNGKMNGNNMNNNMINGMMGNNMNNNLNNMSNNMNNNMSNNMNNNMSNNMNNNMSNNMNSNMNSNMNTNKRGNEFNDINDNFDFGDMSSLMSLLGMMGNQGFGATNNNYDRSNIISPINNKEDNIIENDNTVEVICDKDIDSNMEMLRAVRSFVDEDRGRFLDKVMEMYTKGKIKY